MPNTTIPQVATIGTRPTTTPDGTPIPAAWPIHNAPRPLYGTLCWQQPQTPFRAFGWFFAALDPADEWGNGQRGTSHAEENRRLDARELVFVSDEAAYQRGCAELRDRYGTRLADLETKLLDPAYRDHLVTTGIRAMSIEEDA